MINLLDLVGATGQNTTPSMVQRMPTSEFISEWTFTQVIWDISSGGALARGGDWDAGTRAGVFAAGMRDVS